MKNHSRNWVIFLWKMGRNQEKRDFIKHDRISAVFFNKNIEEAEGQR
ncbi:hypothetical protein JOC73_000469 [Alkaliphilus hydrothermalis]|uniref:Uncharacterized protein n=1 Tax=Alkaliphilus hydrothermalis TaxID=1482730 RepID=A0ABS2NM14_9FIRM|nr:hypothetical protein [Alkaliphilus hydrothermalis]